MASIDGYRLANASERERLMQVSREKRTREEHLVVMHRRLSTLETAINTLANAFQVITDAYNVLRADYDFYDKAWGKNPDAPPVRLREEEG